MVDRICEIYIDNRGQLDGQVRHYPLGANTTLVSCTAGCPYGNRLEATIKDPNDLIERPICKTSGRVAG